MAIVLVNSLWAVLCLFSVAWREVGKDTGTKWRHYPSGNLAKRLLDFSVTIPRERLRPRYGDGFDGAPLRASPSAAGAPILGDRGSHERANAPDSAKEGGPGGL